MCLEQCLAHSRCSLIATYHSQLCGPGLWTPWWKRLCLNSQLLPQCLAHSRGFYASWMNGLEGWINAWTSFTWLRFFVPIYIIEMLLWALKKKIKKHFLKHRPCILSYSRHLKHLVSFTYNSKYNLQPTYQVTGINYTKALYIHTVSSHPHNIISQILSSLYYRWEGWNMERLRGRAGIRSHVCLTPPPVSPLYSTHCLFLSVDHL